MCETSLVRRQTEGGLFNWLDEMDFSDISSEHDPLLTMLQKSFWENNQHSPKPDHYCLFDGVYNVYDKDGNLIAIFGKDSWAALTKK